MPLLRGIARTAVVAGTATAVSNRVSRRQYERWQQEEPQAYAEPTYTQAPPPAAPPAPEADPVQQLKELGSLREQGILTDEEFDAQKTRILSSMS
jgi:Short C-terminal domain